MLRALARGTCAALFLLLGTAMPSPSEAAPVIGNFNRSGVTAWSTASEPSIAVGPYQVLTQIQGGVAAYTKDGTPLEGYYTPGGGQPYLSSNLFYGLTGPDPSGIGNPPSYYVDAVPQGSPYPGTSNLCQEPGFCPPGARDPLMMFDPSAQRFYALAWSYTHLNLNVSKSSDLRDGWFYYHINLDPNGTFQDVFWDRPSLGFSTDKIVLSSWYRSEIIVLDKSALISSAYGLVPHTFTYGNNSYGTHLDLPANAIVRIPTSGAWARVCANLSSTADVYMVRTQGVSAGVFRFEVARVSGSPASPSLQVFQNGMQVALDGSPPTVEQPGPDPLHVQATVPNTAISNPFYRDPFITIAAHQWVPAQGGTLALRVFEINTSTMLVTTDETVTSSATGVSYAFPSAIRDAEGNLYVGFNASGPNLYPSTYITARKAGESSLSTPLLAHSGEVESIDQERWGDFTGIALDECSSGRATAYFAGQFSHDQSNALASWVTSFRFEPPNTPTACTSDGVWHTMNPTVPPTLYKRSDATTTWDPVGNRFIVYGGYSKYYNTYFNDVWSYTPATNSWTQLATSAVPRARHTAVYDAARNRIVVFGGENQNGRRNDVWALSLSGTPAWTAISTTGGPPSVRASHVAVYDPVRDQMVIHGGVAWNPALTWKLTFASNPANQWTQISASSPPAEFEGCSAIYDPVSERMMVFGGRLYVTASCPNPWLVNSNTTYSLSLSAPTQWTLHNIANPPPTRAFAAAVYDPLYKRMIVHGGIQDQVCDGGGPPACGETLEKGLTDAYALTLATPTTWTPIGGFCYDGPTPRGRHSAVYDASANKIYAFGGMEKRATGSTCPTTEHNDVWRLTLPDVTAPAAVTNLLPTLSTDGGTITWTAPGDDGTQGTACEYDLRYSTATITAANFHLATPILTSPPHASGSAESAEVTDLEGCSWYSFALKTRDGSGNWSALSNTPKRQTMCFITGGADSTSDSQEGAALPVSVDLRLASEHPAQSALKIGYAIPAGDRGSVLNLAVFDLLGRRVNTLIEGKAEPGQHVTTWNLRDREGGRVKNGIYFLKLRVGDEERRQKVLVVE